MHLLLCSPPQQSFKCNVSPWGLISCTDGLLYIIGVKRDAERYKFSEPRPPVDAVWARSRESAFSIWKAAADLNFVITFAKKALLGPKTHFGDLFRFLDP